MKSGKDGVFSGTVVRTPIISWPGKGDPVAEVPTPQETGFHVPAEWEPQDSVWLSWPHDEETFPELPAVVDAYCAIIRASCRSGRIDLLVRDEEAREQVRSLLGKSGGIPEGLCFHEIDYADVWIRDYGPTFLVNRKTHELAMVNWRFNAWGNKYPELLYDDCIPSMMNRELGIRCFSPGVVLEGGSIDVNGKGTVMTTEQCLLNANRNPGLGRAEIEAVLREYLGCSRVIWLSKGIAGDDTDGHVDDIARFVNERTVVCAVEENPYEDNYSVLRENYLALQRSTDQDGRPLTVIPLPMPGHGGDGEPLPASYANFLITNRVVLMPVFGHRNDDRARAVLASVFPDREVIGIDCRALVKGLGAVHCISQQQPVP
ncbi:MAG: agmatine deiminase family protein [Methanomicrobiales archaeon]|nr:agmatine deiminase family protein [Methanomicrobiales archaeon]